MSTCGQALPTRAPAVEIKLTRLFRGSHDLAADRRAEAGGRRGAPRGRLVRMPASAQIGVRFGLAASV